MKQTYTDIIATAQDGVGSTNASIKTFLKQRINERYELVTDKLNTWTQIATRTATSGVSATVSQQYYYNPPNLREIESIVIRIGSYDYNLKPVDSQMEWDNLNAEPQADSAFPSRYFRRINDYGIWPFDFQDKGIITINYTQRASPLYFEDYSTGTVVATGNSKTLTVTTGVTTTWKAGFWFTLTDSSGEPRGTWYKIGSISSSSVVLLETFFEEATDSGATYLVGQVPEIPEEGHSLFAIGAISDFYALKQKDTETATRFDNKFWSGNFNVTPLQAKKDKDYGGLLALIDAYENRDSGIIVDRGNSGSRDAMEFRIPSKIIVL